MFTSVLDSHTESLAHFAESWLASGATGYAIWVDGELLRSWPEDVNISHPDLTENIWVTSQLVGELRLAGLNTPSAQIRLRGEADLIARLLALEGNLDSLAEELVETRDQLVALYSISQATQGFQEIEQILNAIACETARLSRANGVFLYLEGITSFPLTASSSEISLDLSFLSSVAERVQANGPQVFPLDLAVISSIPMQGSLLLCPIQVHEAKCAVLGIIHKDSDFNAPDFKIAKAISEFARIQIENFLMLQRNIEFARLNTEMELAQRVQANLLPKQIPQLPGLEIWTACNSASHVGGDFFDCILRPDQSFVFTVGDISGKGMPAALLMAMTRTLIRKEALSESQPTPEAILRQINVDLYKDFTELNMFATVFIGQYEISSRRLVYANAGHSPVFYYPTADSASLLRADGTAMGILPTSQSKDHFIQLQPGDIFLVGTDGLCEVQNGMKKNFGYDRLQHFINGFADRNAREITETLFCLVKDFANKEPQMDDQTLIVLKCTGQ